MNLNKQVFALNEKMTKRYDEIIGENLEEAKTIAEEMHRKCLDCGLLDQAQKWADKLPHLRAAIKRLKSTQASVEEVPVVVEVVVPTVIEVPEDEETVEFVDEEVVSCEGEEETVDLVQDITIPIIDEEETVEAVSEEVIVVEDIDEDAVTTVTDDLSATPKKKRKRTLN